MARTNNSSGEKEQYNNKMLYGRKARLAITIFLSGASTGCMALVTRFPADKPILTVSFLVLGWLFLALQILYSTKTIAIDKQTENALQNASKRMNVYKMLFESLTQTFQQEAEGINKIAKDIQNTGIIPKDRWTFDKSAEHMCQAIKRFITDLAITGEDINVSYVRIDGSTNDHILLVAYANNRNEAPDIWDIRRPISNAADSYYDARMFYRHSVHWDYRLKPEDVDAVFHYKDREKYSGIYEQFLFIPVTCDGNKMVGMIEIVAERGTIIARNAEEMKKVRKLMQIFASVLLLLHKTEKAAIAIPQTVPQNP